MSAEKPIHSNAFRIRRFINWFPMGLTYAFLYMGRYNLTVSKNALGDLMTKSDFGIIFFEYDQDIIDELRVRDKLDLVYNKIEEQIEKLKNEGVSLVLKR